MYDCGLCTLSYTWVNILIYGNITNNIKIYYLLLNRNKIKLIRFRSILTDKNQKAI